MNASTDSQTCFSDSQSYPLFDSYPDGYNPWPEYLNDMALGPDLYGVHETDVQIKKSEDELALPLFCCPFDISTTHVSSISPVSASSEDYIPPKQPVEADTSISVVHANSYTGFPTKLERVAIQENPDTFLREQFPHANQSEVRDRVRRDIIPTLWWLNNQLEPSRALHPFIQRVKAKVFECTACHKNLSRLDRALDHFRSHINHRPFMCNGAKEELACGAASCAMRFYTKDCLKAHCAKTDVVCNNCGTQVEDKNLHRHQATRKCHRYQPYSRSK